MPMLAIVPSWVWKVILVFAFVVVMYYAIRKWKKEQDKKEAALRAAENPVSPEAYADLLYSQIICNYIGDFLFGKRPCSTSVDTDALMEIAGNIADNKVPLEDVVKAYLMRYDRSLLDDMQGSALGETAYAQFLAIARGGGSGSGSGQTFNALAIAAKLDDIITCASFIGCYGDDNAIAAALAPVKTITQYSAVKAEFASADGGDLTDVLKKAWGTTEFQIFYDKLTK